jgi:Fe-S-cluster containining protein
MENKDKIRLDANKQALYFTGGCADAETCQAVCCRNWNVLVGKDELASQRYDVETLCLCSNNPCAKSEIHCLNRRVRLKRKLDGSCVYLDERNRCSIYSLRPVVCRSFTCENGWKLSPQVSDMRLDATGTNPAAALTREALGMDLVLLKNPAIEFKTSFYSKEDREIVLVLKRIDKCGTVSCKALFDSPVTRDDVFPFIIRECDGSKDCAAVCHNLKNSFGIELSDNDFLDIVLLLLMENVLLFKRAPSLNP